MLGTTNSKGNNSIGQNLSISINGTQRLSYNGKTAASLNITLASLGAAASNHNHDAIYSKLNHTHSYLPISGGKMTGALNLKNSTWNLSGDDAYFGDNNLAGCFCIKGNNGTTGIALVKYGDDKTFQTIKSDGTNMTIDKNLNILSSLSEAGCRVTTKQIIASGNINQLDKFWTVYNNAPGSTSGVTGLESVASYGLCMTVDGIGTPFQIWFPDNRYLIAKKNKVNTAFNILQFCRMQSSAPHTDIIWCC